MEPLDKQRGLGLLLGSLASDIVKTLWGLLEVCSGESVWEQHTAQTNSYAQTDKCRHTHAHTMDKKSDEKRQSLFFACVKMSQGGDKHIQRDAMENSNFLG